MSFRHTTAGSGTKLTINFVSAIGDLKLTRPHVAAVSLNGGMSFTATHGRGEPLALATLVGAVY